MSRLRFVAAVGLTFVVLGCSPTPVAPLLTDPHEIMVTAIRATSSLAFVRLHADLRVSPVGAAPGDGDVQLGLDVDMDVLHRLRAGRVATQMTGGFAGQAGQETHVQEFIALADASYSREAGAARWTKFPGAANGDPPGPTNASFASIQGLLSNPGVKLELRDAAPCSLGTCYHVVATTGGQIALTAIGAALGQQEVVNLANDMPPFVFDVLVDQATGLLSEVRFQATLQGNASQLVALFSNPDVPVQIVAPPPAFVDDFGAGVEGVGGAVGGQIPAATPMLSEGP